MGKFKIPLSNLPPPNEDGNHIFRFRVTSEDKVQVSEYSTLYVIQSSGQVFPDKKESDKYRIIKSSASTITVTWEAPSKYNIGALAQTQYNSNLGVNGIIMQSASATSINISGIVPNIYLKESITLGAVKFETYNFYEKVSRTDAQKIIDKLKLQPGVISGEFDAFILTPITVFPDQSTKWGNGEVDIFVQYPLSASVSASTAYSYYGRTKEGQVSFLPESAGLIRIIAQSSSYPIQVNEKYKIFDTGVFDQSAK